MIGCTLAPKGNLGISSYIGLKHVVNKKRTSEIGADWNPTGICFRQPNLAAFSPRPQVAGDAVAAKHRHEFNGFRTFRKNTARIETGSGCAPKRCRGKDRVDGARGARSRIRRTNGRRSAAAACPEAGPPMRARAVQGRKCRIRSGAPLRAGARSFPIALASLNSL